MALNQSSNLSYSNKEMRSLNRPSKIASRMQPHNSLYNKPHISNLPIRRMNDIHSTPPSSFSTASRISPPPTDLLNRIDNAVKDEKPPITTESVDQTSLNLTKEVQKKKYPLLKRMRIVRNRVDDLTQVSILETDNMKCRFSLSDNRIVIAIYNEIQSQNIAYNLDDIDRIELATRSNEITPTMVLIRKPKTLSAQTGNEQLEEALLFFSKKEPVLYQELIKELQEKGLKTCDVEFDKLRDRFNMPEEIPVNTFYGGTTNKMLTRSRTLGFKPSSAVEMVFENVPTSEQILFEPTLNYKFEDKKTFHISNNDFQGLYNTNWVNDTIVDFFLKYNLYCARDSGKTSTYKIELMNSFFYRRLEMSSLNQDCYEGVKSWFKNNDTLFDNDYVIIPIMDDHHWFVVIITDLAKLKKRYMENDPEYMDLDEDIGSSPTEPMSETIVPSTASSTTSATTMATESTTTTSTTTTTSHYNPNFRYRGVRNLARINVLDSLRKDHRKVLDILKGFLIGYAKDKYNMDVDPVTIYKRECSVPMQSNFNDCGLHVIYNIARLYEEPGAFHDLLQARKSRGIGRLFFHDEDKKNIRRKLRESLLKLLKDQVKADGGDESLVGTQKLGDLPVRIDEPANASATDKGIANDEADDDDDLQIISVVEPELPVEVSNPQDQSAPAVEPPRILNEEEFKLALEDLEKAKMIAFKLQDKIDKGTTEYEDLVLRNEEDKLAEVRMKREILHQQKEKIQKTIDTLERDIAHTHNQKTGIFNNTTVNETLTKEPSDNIISSSPDKQEMLSKSSPVISSAETPAEKLSSEFDSLEIRSKEVPSDSPQTLSLEKTIQHQNVDLSSDVYEGDIKPSVIPLEIKEPVKSNSSDIKSSTIITPTVISPTVKSPTIKLPTTQSPTLKSPTIKSPTTNSHTGSKSPSSLTHNYKPPVSLNGPRETFVTENSKIKHKYSAKRHLALTSSQDQPIKKKSTITRISLNTPLSASSGPIYPKLKTSTSSIISTSISDFSASNHNNDRSHSNSNNVVYKIKTHYPQENALISKKPDNGGIDSKGSRTLIRPDFMEGETNLLQSSKGKGNLEKDSTNTKKAFSQSTEEKNPSKDYFSKYVPITRENGNGTTKVNNQSSSPLPEKEVIDLSQNSFSLIAHTPASDAPIPVSVTDSDLTVADSADSDTDTNPDRAPTPISPVHTVTEETSQASKAEEISEHIKPSMFSKVSKNKTKKRRLISATPEPEHKPDVQQESEPVHIHVSVPETESVPVMIPVHLEDPILIPSQVESFSEPAEHQSSVQVLDSTDSLNADNNDNNDVVEAIYLNLEEDEKSNEGTNHSSSVDFENGNESALEENIITESRRTNALSTSPKSNRRRSALVTAPAAMNQSEETRSSDSKGASVSAPVTPRKRKSLSDIPQVIREIRRPGTRLQMKNRIREEQEKFIRITRSARNQRSSN